MSHLTWMSNYGFDPSAQHGWAYGISGSLNEINSAYLQYKMPSLYRMDLDDSIFIRYSNGTGYMLGDELTCSHGIPFSNVTAVADQLRNEIGNEPVIYDNECNTCFVNGSNHQWPYMPESLTFWSYDYYDWDNGTHEAEFIINHYEKNVFKYLQYTKYEYQQQVLLVSGTFGCNGTSDLNFRLQQIINDLNILFEWAKNQTLVAGFNPWHYLNHSTITNYKKSQCDFTYGASAMPAVVQKLTEIGQYMLGV
eukprot:433747_1